MGREREYVTGDTLGVVYLLHFDQPIGNPENRRAMASHYLGWTIDLERRLRLHRSGRGSPLVAAVVAAGIGFEVFTWHGTPADERHFKEEWKNSKLLCPRCAGVRCRMKLQPLDQALLSSSGSSDSDEWPAAPAHWPIWDGYQVAKLRGWRKARAAELALPVETEGEAPAWHIPF